MKTPDKGAGSAREISRRKFMASAGAVAASRPILKPQQIAGADPNSKITLGLIGCGGRGSWIANLFRKQGGYQPREVTWEEMIKANEKLEFDLKGLKG